MKYKEGDIVEITWLDACGEQRESIEELNKINPASCLVKTKTYGVLHAEDDLAIIVVEEISESECDFTCIPKSLIKNIKILK